MNPIEECFKCAQGKVTEHVEQDAQFKTLATVLNQMTDIVLPVDGVELLTIFSQGKAVASALSAYGTYVAKNQSVQSFFEDCYMSTVESIKSLDLEERNELFSAVFEMLLNAFLNFCALCTDQKSNSPAATTRLPVILCHHMYVLPPRN